MNCPVCKDDDCVESTQLDQCSACGWTQNSPVGARPVQPKREKPYHCPTCGAFPVEIKKPDPVDQLKTQIEIDVYAKVQADASVDMGHLRKQLHELVELARGSK